MKTIFALLLLTAGPLCAQSESLDLDSHGRLTIYLTDAWKFDVSDFGDRRIVTISPKGDANASCTLTVTFPETDRYDTKARLRMRVEIDGEKIASSSVEGKAVAKEFTLRSCFGFYCNFTDPDLVGKPPEKGNYKVISAGMIRAAPDVLIEVGISADDFRGNAYQDLLGAVEGMDFEAPAERKH